MEFVAGLVIGFAAGHFMGAKIIETVKGWLAKKPE